ncbi:MAG: MBL fold metallo-hydrolase [Chthoniobacterales bacterium]
MSRQSDNFSMLQFKQFTGGVFETNGYLIEAPEGNLLIDAPDGIASAFTGQSIDMLFLTHGHFDHIADAAKVKQRYDCRVACHAETVPMIEDPEFFRRYGFQLEIEPVKADLLIEESPSLNLLGLDFQVLYVPGHCPGSLCLYEPISQILFGGDVLFQGAIGRWDLPGGDKDLLLKGIRTKVLPLPAATRVLSGHGPETTVSQEAATNPWLNS